MRKLLYSFLFFIFSKSFSKQRSFSISLQMYCLGIFFGFANVVSGQITQPTAWTKAYDQASLTCTGTNLTVAAGSNRVLVVAITSTYTSGGGSGTQVDPTTITYGGVTLTRATSNGGTSARTHTWLYYLKDNAVMDATSRPLNVTGAAVANSTLANMTVWYSIFEGVDQSPTTYTAGSGLSNSGSSAAVQLSSAMAININEQAIYVSSIYNDNSSAIPTYTINTNWTSGGTSTSTSGGTGWKNEVTKRNIPASNVTDNASTSTTSGNTRYAMSAMSLPKVVPTITSLGSSSGCIGGNITINGTNLAGATVANVRIGGTAVSSITSISASQIVAVIGSGTTGTVTVTNANGTATSGTTFTINSLPTTSNAGPDQNGNTSFTLAANTPSVGTGAWTIASGPSTSLSQFSSTTSPTATFTPYGTGTYTLVWTISNTCGTSTDQVDLVANCVSNLIKNGDFKNGTTDWSPANGQGWKTEVTTEGIYFGNGGSDNTAELDSEASLRQQVTVIPGVQYTLSFLYARRPSSPSPVAVDARIVGGATTPAVNYTTTNNTSTPFIGTLTFTATTSTVYVEFYNSLAGSSTLGSIVDNIVLVPSSQVTPVATTSPKGPFKTLTACAGTAVQLDVENVPASGVTYSWSSTSPGAVFSSTTIKNPTITFSSTLTGPQEATVVVTSTGGCAGAPSSTYVNLLAAPTVYNVTGGTSCFGTGIVVGLSGSSTNVSYRLQLDGVNNGAAISGTGSAISFGSKTAAGTYTVIATNTASNTCSLTMSGSAVIKQIQSAPTIASYTDLDCVNSGTVTLGNLPAGAWQINQTGQATATIAGSGTPYQITGLAAGNYTFTVQTATTCVSSSVSRSIADISTSTWNGSTWVGGAPDSTKKIIIASGGGTPFPTGTPVVNGCSLTINTGIDVTVQSGVTLVITNAVTTNGTLTFENNSSLVQTTNVANTGSITYKRLTSVRRYDLTYWSIPVTNSAFRLNTLSPGTLNDKYYTYDDDLGWVVDFNGMEVMQVGLGYSVRAPQTFSLTAPEPFTAEFKGIPNNGNIAPVVKPGRFNLVGNPYPSAISATALYSANANLGTIYLWTHNILPAQTVPGDSKYYYGSDDFASFNLSGGAGGALLNGLPFQGIIAAGQGFIAEPKTATMNFNNSMRVNGSNTQFYKTDGSGDLERNRLWLKFSNDQGAYKQMLVGYIEGATNNNDINYDAVSMESNTYVDFYSINESQKLTIQGRALPFENTDVVPLGYRTTIAGEFTIAIDYADGFFDTQEVYLEDLATDKIINLRTQDYKFTTAIGTFANRFNLRYTSKTLGTGEFENLENTALVSVNNKVVKITSSKETIKEVNVYNIGGQLLYTKNKVNSSELQISNLNSSDQVLLVKVTLENGHTLTKKIIFSNL